MFSVFDRNGRLFHGSLEDLSQVSAIHAVQRSQAILPVGQDPAAYEGARHPFAPRHAVVCVQELMTSPAFTVDAQASLQTALDLLQQQGLRQAPVVDAKGALVGLLELTAIYRLQSQALPLTDHPVLAHMQSPVPSVAPGTDIRRLARVLLDTGLPGLPVTADNGDLRGFISRTDLLRAMVAEPPLDLWT